MNIREGIRRVAIVAGGVGAIFGAVGSYVQLHDVFDQRSRHDEFQALLDTPAVRRDVSLLRNGLAKAKDPTPAFEYGHHGQDWFIAAAAVAGSEDGWGIYEDGVGKIYFDGEQQVNCITTTYGSRLYPTASPGFVSYFLPLGWPILGFALPWALFKIIIWVGSGFVHKPQI